MRLRTILRTIVSYLLKLDDNRSSSAVRINLDKKESVWNRIKLKDDNY